MSEADVRLWHLADIRRVSLHVRFWVNSGHQRAAIRRWGIHLWGEST